MSKIDFKVFGDTQEERERVLLLLDGDAPELDMPYMEHVDKRFSNRPPKTDFDVVLDPAHIDQAMCLIKYFRTP